LDEIAELPFEMQAKLLRVIENKEIQKIGTSISVYSDFRLIAATNKDLATLVREGTFREDLYHRLHILVLQVPPLRERSEDILLLVPHLLRELEDKPQSLDISFSPEVKQLLQGYAWPGNIRELRNVLSFAILSLDDGQNEIRLRNLPPYLVEKGILKVRLFKDDSCSLIQAREKSEKEALVAAMERSPLNKSKAAKILGISRNELYKKIKKYGL
jgi:transcriptional regulator with PAS, ATPase and Fis domain